MALNRKTFPKVTAAADTFTPSEHFNTVLYTGTGATQRIGGYINRGAVFNGSSSKISDVYQIDYGNTISMWVNVDNTVATGTYYGLWTQGDGTTDYAGIRYKRNSGDNYTIEAFIRDGNDYIYRRNTSSTWTAGWNHFVFIINTTTGFDFYLNGSNGNFSNWFVNGTFTNVDFSDKTAVLGLYATSTYYKGKLDHVRFFNKELSTSEVTTLYEETHASTTKSTTDIFNDGSGVALYQLDGNPNDTGGVSGKYGSAAIFNGSSSFISYTDKLIPTSGAFSISWWMNWDGDADYAYVFDNGGGSASNGLYCIAHDTLDTLYFGFKNGSTLFQSNSGAPSIEKNTWIHWVLSWDGTTGSNAFKVYKNNSVTNFTSTVTNTTANYNFRIGESNGTGGEHLKGRIDDFRVYSDVLTSAEVGYIYNNTTASIPTDNLVAHYKFDGDARDETISPSYDGVATNVKYAYDGTASNIVYQEATKFTPDLVMIKNRDDVVDHKIFDSIRGATKVLESSTTDAEGTQVGSLTSFDDTGFTLGTNNSVNGSNDDIVAWCFNAGTDAAAQNTDGNITSTVKANTAAGFSIVKYAGNSTATQTIGHGLSSAPELIITKNRNDAEHWVVGNTNAGWTKGLYLSATNAAFTNNKIYGVAPTDSVYTVSGSGFDSSNTLINTTGKNYIAYCFHSVDGYQKIGSYSGNNGTQMIETGFQPQFLLIKNTSSTNNWIIVDEERSTSNPRKLVLEPNTNDAESTETVNINFTSNGFELTSGNSDVNDGSATYIYLAIAADPDETTPTVENSFDVVTYTGTGSTKTIEVDFKPDLVWIKSRTQNLYHFLADSVRGSGLANTLSSNTTDRESFATEVVVNSFDTNGFTLNSDDGAGYYGWNINNQDSVAWCWKAGDHDDNLPEINDNGTIDSTVSVNDAAGFSIVKYTGNGGSGQSVGHGLSSAPEMVIFKRTDAVQNWFVFVKVGGVYKRFEGLNTTAAAGSVSSFSASSASITWSGTTADFNGSGKEYIMYCFYSVTGYSKIGSYTGNGTTLSVTTGFAPRFVMLKPSSLADNWMIYDTSRGADIVLFPNLSNADTTYAGRFSFLSNGFQLSTSNSGWNGNGSTYIYMAFK